MEGTRLALLSLDSLMAIAERLDGISVTLLAQTCPKLHRALFRDGTLRVFQVCARRLNNQIRIPSFVGLLPYLTTLSISLGKPTSVGPLSTYLSRPLPRTLQILRLEFVEAEALFSMSPLETALVMLMRYPPKDGEQPVSDLKTAFPNLHTLELAGKSSIRPTHLLNLPPTLTRICFAGDDIDNDSLSLLPRGLVSLTINHATCLSAFGFLFLPPHLEELVLPKCDAGVEEYQALPPSITRFIAKKNFIARLAPKEVPPAEPAPRTTRKGPTSRRNTGKMTAAPTLPVINHGPSDILCIPRTLTNLHISLSKCQDDNEKLGILQCLPQNLVELRIEDFSASASAIEMLPRTLKKLVMISEEQLIVVPASCWPPKLEKLTVIERRATSISFQMTLPDSLTSLRLGEHVISLSYVRVLPKTLKKLCIANPKHLTIDEYERIPQSVTKLQLLNLGANYNSAALGKLPPALKSLILHGNALFDDLVFPRLPKTLTELVFEVKNTKWCKHENFASLPPGLKTFGINCPLSTMPIRSLAEVYLPELTTLGYADLEVPFPRWGTSEEFIPLPSPRIADHFFIPDMAYGTTNEPGPTLEPMVHMEPPLIRVVDPHPKQIGARKHINSRKKQDPYPGAFW